jgi:hypothetical protein
MTKKKRAALAVCFMGWAFAWAETGREPASVPSPRQERMAKLDKDRQEDPSKTEDDQSESKTQEDKSPVWKPGATPY